MKVLKSSYMYMYNNSVDGFINFDKLSAKIKPVYLYVYV